MFSKWSTSKPKRTRIRTTPEQLAVLEASFAEQQHPEPEERSRLAEATGMTTRRVSVWFQNRRAKERSKNGAAPRPRKPRETPYVALDPPSPSRVQQEQQLLLQQQMQQQQQAQMQMQQQMLQQQQMQQMQQQQRGQAQFVDFAVDHRHRQQQQQQQQQHVLLQHPHSASYALPTGRSLSAGATVGARAKTRDLRGRSSLYAHNAVSGEFAHSAPGRDFMPRREFSPNGTPMREYSPSSMDCAPSSPLRDYHMSPSRDPLHLPMREYSPTASSPVYRRRDFRQSPAMLEFAASNSRGDYALGAVSREFSGERAPSPMYGALPPVTMEQEVRRASSTPKKHVVVPPGTDLRRFSLSEPDFQGFSSFSLGSDDPFLRLEAARAHTSSGSDDIYTEEEEEAHEEERYARKKQVLLSRQKLMAQEMMVRHEDDGDTTMAEA